MFTDRLPRTTGLLLAAALLLVPGCLERKETIRVARDGSVSLRVELEGDPGDFASGDALPDEDTGWQTRDWFTEDDEGNKKQQREALLRVSPGRSLPDSYAAPDNPNYATALAFPTELLIERGRDGTYYHFRRVYEGREQARYEYHKQVVEKSEPQMDLSGKDPAELTDEERTCLLNKLRRIQAGQMTEYVRTGAAALEDLWPQHYGLTLRRAVLDYFDGIDMEPLLALLHEPESPDRDSAIDAYGKETLRGAREVLVRELRVLRVPRAQADEFFDAYDEEEARRAVTEDLGDESWEVRVELPGEIVAHNGDALEGKAVVWVFDGKLLMDRDHVLMVTSRVTRGGRAHDDRE